MSTNRNERTPAATWDPNNIFAGTASYYARYRLGYPDEVINLLRDRFSLTEKSRVLDLGCGTGQVALALSPYVSEVVAVDPQEDMLEEGRKLASAKAATNVVWIKGQSGNIPELSALIGTVRLTVIARAFHWMDRELTLRDLHALTAPDGGVAVIQDNGPTDGAPLPWKDTVNQAVKRWLGEQRRAGAGGTFSAPPKRPEVVLRESQFRDLELTHFTLERTWSVEQILGYLYSTSSSSIPVLGDKREPFETDLKQRLDELNPAGQFIEEVKVNLMLVWKR